MFVTELFDFPAKNDQDSQTWGSIWVCDQGPRPHQNNNNGCSDASDSALCLGKGTWQCQKKGGKKGLGKS